MKQTISSWWTSTVYFTIVLDPSPSLSWRLCFTEATTRFYSKVYRYIHAVWCVWFFLPYVWFWFMIDWEMIHLIKLCVMQFCVDVISWSLTASNLIISINYSTEPFLTHPPIPYFPQNTQRKHFPYERRTQSKAYIPIDEGDYYYTAAVWGGYLEDMYTLVK